MLPRTLLHAPALNPARHGQHLQVRPVRARSTPRRASTTTARLLRDTTAAASVAVLILPYVHIEPDTLHALTTHAERPSALRSRARSSLCGSRVRTPGSGREYVGRRTLSVQLDRRRRKGKVKASCNKYRGSMWRVEGATQARESTGSSSARVRWQNPWLRPYLRHARSGETGARRGGE
ncbi:hypothetical protein K466DRAFT_78666 [Polyporus arcularius HHB13444]|uniref:Uncharacterized protein n=1 Tax=Polyporus arcularius HHB13444 TaxID=1314778 RepID=A0A5C3NP22_9APHY|nr:hypothetical protein K466DRAFT_78666 [Polyporus arcularius HHB13444]